MDFQALLFEELDFHTAKGFISQIMVVSLGFPVLATIVIHLPTSSCFFRSETSLTQHTLVVLNPKGSFQKQQQWIQRTLATCAEQVLSTLVASKKQDF